MTRLQLAIDLVDPADFGTVIAPLVPLVDVIEAGTPLIKRYGLSVIRTLRDLAAERTLVADMKAMDAGALEAEMAFDAGADMMTVLGCAGDATIAAALAVARDRGKVVVVDLIGVADKPARAKELAALGVQWLGIHSGTDDQASGANPLDDLAAIRAAVDSRVVVAGGINERTLPAILRYEPDIAIVGSGILGQPDPLAAATRLSDLLGAGGNR
jgi:3-hexulose-6-phosphate synthase